MSGSPVIEIDGVILDYGSGANAVRAIDGVDLAVERGEFLSIVGPSGCGKTSLLMCIAGLRRPTGGAIRVHGREVTDPDPGLSLVFQDYSRSLFPWYTNAENLGLALWDAGLAREARIERIDRALHSVGLDNEGGRYPWQLSGGMQQRVAIARALVTEPEVLVMDEPFASVDAQTRATLEDLLLQVWEQTGVTVVFVTHDIDEAVYMSDRVVTLSSRPARVVENLEIGLPRPRDQLHTRAMPEFAAARSRVYELIMQ